jgi:hypothetical protein
MYILPISISWLVVLNSVIVISASSVPVGPYPNQQYCVTTISNGITYHLNEEPAYIPVLIPNSRCVNTSCTVDNWVADACVKSELSRCACSLTSSTSMDLVISGFSMDRSTFSGGLKFIDDGGTCLSSPRSLFVRPTHPHAPTVAPNGFSATSDPIRVIRPGKYLICLSDSVIGTIIARPDCPPPMVQFNYACFDYCPSGFVPHFGDCRSVRADIPPDLPLALNIPVIYSNADALDIAHLPSTDSTFQYFSFIAVSNFQRVLFEQNNTRFFLSGLDDGMGMTDRPEDLVIITMVIVPSGGVLGERTSGELFTLWTALVSDLNSVIYTNPFFSSIQPKLVSEQFILVTQCPSSTGYYTSCPLSSDPFPDAPTSPPGWYFVGAIVGGVVGGLVGAAAMVASYRIDTGNQKHETRGTHASAHPISIDDLIEQDNDFSVIKLPPGKRVESQDDGHVVSPTRRMYTEVPKLDAVGRAEFARDWLEGKLLNEEIFLRPRRRRKDAVEEKDTSGPRSIRLSMQAPKRP